MSTRKPHPSSLPFRRIHDDHGGYTRVPIEGFNYEAVFNNLDGVDPESEQAADPLPLIETLTPRELQHAHAIPQSIVRKSSKRARSARAAWLDPVRRQRRAAAIFRAAQNPEVQRKKSVAMRRYWQNRDRHPKRCAMFQLWRERRPELLTSMREAMRGAEYRRRLSNRTRALWADPIFRQKVMAKVRSQEGRRKASIATLNYFNRQPEARQRSAERARAMWRGPDYSSASPDVHLAAA